MIHHITNPSRRKAQRNGNHWFMFVEDGEVSYLDHHVAWIWSFIVHPKHPQGTHWTSGQPYLSSLLALRSFQNQAQTTSSLHLSRAIAYVTSSWNLPVGNWKKSLPRCRCHFQS